MSVLPFPASDSTMPAPLSEPTVEVGRLRHLIEKQPFGLMRVGSDGLLLAANDVAVELLRAGELGQALNTMLTVWIVPEHHDQWHEFAARIRSGTPSSLECDLTDPSGLPRTILFHGVPLLDHPDGIPSMIVGAQDVSSRRRLEKMLQEGEARRQQLIAEQAGERVQLQQTLGERHQLERLLKEGRKHLHDLRAQLEQAVEEGHRLETLQQERDTSHQRLMTEAAADWEQLQQTLAEQHRLDLLSKEQGSQQQVDGLRAQLEQAVAEGQRLETLLAERNTSHQQLVAEHASERVRVQQTLAEQHRLDLLSKEQGSQQQVDGLRAQLEHAVAEGHRLETLLAGHDTSHQRLMAEHATERAQAEQALAAATSREKWSTKALDDRRVELESLEESVRDLASLAAAGRAALEVGRELLEVSTAVDARSASLLTECPVEAAGRKEIEAIRGDAIRVKSLAYQIVEANPNASARTVSPKVPAASVNPSSSSGRPV